MRKAWRRIFLLCAACMICMCGLCLAKDGGNLVELGRIHWFTCYVDPSSVKTRQWGGRKYLEIEYYNKMDEWNTYNLAAIDIENRKGVILVDGARVINDISDIENGVMSPYVADFIENLINWTEQNRPDIINEIRTFNHSGQSAGTTNVTGAAGAPSGEISAGGLEYEVLDSGAVKLVLRRGGLKSDMERYANEEDYWKANTYYIFTKPEEFNAWRGTYAVGCIYTYGGKDILGVGSFFDYDAVTKTVQFYGDDIGQGGNAPERAMYGSRIRVIDRNTVYREEPEPVGSYLTNGPFQVGIYVAYGEKYPQQYTYRYLPCNDSNNRDWNGGAWTTEFVYKDGKRELIYTDGYSNEIAILCCALNGNFGEMPQLPNVQEFEHGSDYNFPL